MRFNARVWLGSQNGHITAARLVRLAWALAATGRARRKGQSPGLRRRVLG